MKSRKFGYDGKNQIDIRDANVKNVWEESGKVEAILEKKINFKTELSIIGVCTKSGNTLFYPLVENFHKNGILDISIAPYKDLELQKRAESYHRKISKELNYIGVLVIEFFLTDNEELIANEMAPRVHNSGHWTIEGCSESQFTIHMQAVSGVKIKQPNLLYECHMENLIGSEINLSLIHI